MPTYHLDWRTPPLTENQRLNRWERARRVKDVRLTGRLLTSRLGALGRVEVSLVWIVADHRKRDADNIVPTLKALCDGIVDAAVVKDDTPQFMVKNMPEIEYRKGAVPHFRLIVSALEPNLD